METFALMNIQQLVFFTNFQDMPFA